MSTVNAGSKLVNHRFFEKAFDIYRERYNDENSKVVFLAVSDDSSWIKVILQNRIDVT